jgi:hypothetical protein
MPPPLRRLLEKLAFKIATLQANDQLRSVVELVSGRQKRNRSSGITGCRVQADGDRRMRHRNSNPAV